MRVPGPHGALVDGEARRLEPGDQVVGVSQHDGQVDGPTLPVIDVQLAGTGVDGDDHRRTGGERVVPVSEHVVEPRGGPVDEAVEGHDAAQAAASGREPGEVGGEHGP